MWEWFSKLAAPECPTVDADADAGRSLAVVRPSAVVTPISVKDLPGDPPEFRRDYYKQIDGRCRIKVSMRSTRYSGRSSDGELRQPNGNVVWFNPDRIADKIIDPLLVPFVTQAVREIEAMDRAYMLERPREWVDHKGDRWRLVQ